MKSLPDPPSLHGELIQSSRLRVGLTVLTTAITIGVASAASPIWLSHVSSTSNSTFNYTVVERPETKSRGEHLLQFSLMQRAGESAHPVGNTGIWHASNGWSIFYEKTSSTMSSGLRFSAYMPGPQDDTFLHAHLNAEQPVFKQSILDHPSLNGNPNALLFVTHNWAASGVYNDQFSPVVYHTPTARWRLIGYIPGDEFTPIPENSNFNILVRTPSNQAFVHTATAVNTTNDAAGYRTTLDHPTLNGNPMAQILVTNVWKPDSIGQTFSQMQSVYNTSLARWQLDPVGNVDIPLNSEFHIFCAAAQNPRPPNLTIEKSGGSAELSFETEADFIYRLEQSFSFSSWANDGAEVTGDGSAVQLLRPLRPGAEFYRIRYSIAAP